MYRLRVVRIEFVRDRTASHLCASVPSEPTKASNTHHSPCVQPQSIAGVAIALAQPVSGKQEMSTVIERTSTDVNTLNMIPDGIRLVSV